MIEEIRGAVEKAAQKLYEARVEQATEEYLKCLEQQKNDLGEDLAIDTRCELTYQEKR